MKLLLLLCAGLPVLIHAQEVRPVLSNDYLALIQNDSTHKIKGLLTDSTNSLRNTQLFIRSIYRNGINIKDIRIRNNELILQQAISHRLDYSVSASLAAEWQQPNQQPAVQKEFVQGRSESGKPVWRGPETGEQFSYGPSIYTLQYDGSAYPYDINGRLVPAGGSSEGNERRASPYNNSILRNGSMLNSSVTLMTRYKIYGSPVLSVILRAGELKEQTIVRSQNNRSGNLFLRADVTLQKTKILGTCSYRQQRSSHSNRDGFLNRTYLNSLITPASFSNQQGSTFASGQRSYQPLADNPLFLLNDRGHHFLLRQQTGSLSLQRTFFFKLKTSLTHTFDQIQQLSSEGYQPSSAFYPAGISVQRAAKDQMFRINANAEYKADIGLSGRGTFTLNYINTISRSAIRYNLAHNDYRYARNSHDLCISFSPEFGNLLTESGLVISNKIYASSTSNRQAFLLPAISAYRKYFDIFGVHRFTLKLFGTFNRFNTEVPLSRSFAGNSLLQLSSAEAGQFIPVTEIKHFTDLAPVKQREITGGFELMYDNKLTLFFNWYSRKIKDDIFPVLSGGSLLPVNMADHRNNGIEISLQQWLYKWNPRRFSIDNTLSFTLNRSKVVRVKEGYNHTPIAGFSNVHNTLIKGEPLGIITGNTWLRNGGGQLLIGADGYPLTGNSQGIIGDPTPDFTIKLNNHFSLNDKWDLSMDWQWKKGGDTWNGTQALLDYYGRSAVSAALRSTTGYIFNGVMANGMANTTPVSFYNASLPVEQNRWVRYGPGGVAEDYIQKADCIRLQNIYLSYIVIQNSYRNKSKVQRLSFSLYANNLVIWSAYKGADPEQQLFDQPGASGLDYFNLPSVRSFGFATSIQL